MLEIIKDEQGNIKAVCEWWKVNPDGSFNEQGDIVWVAEVEINPSARNNGILKSFIKIITDKEPNAKAGYFWRQRKYLHRKPKLYTRQQWLKLLTKEK